MSVNVWYVGFKSMAMVSGIHLPRPGIIGRAPRNHLYDPERNIYVPPFELPDRTGHLLAEAPSRIVRFH